MRPHRFREMGRFGVITVAIRLKKVDAEQLFLSAEKAVRLGKGLSIVFHGWVGAIDFDGDELKITVRSRRGARATPIRFMKGTVSPYSRVEIYSPADQIPNIKRALRRAEEEWVKGV